MRVRIANKYRQEVRDVLSGNMDDTITRVKRDGQGRPLKEESGKPIGEKVSLNNGLGFTEGKDYSLVEPKEEDGNHFYLDLHNESMYNVKEVYDLIRRGSREANVSVQSRKDRAKEQLAQQRKEMGIEE